MVDILINIVANIIWAIALSILYKVLLKTIPAKKLWNLNDYNSLKIFVATSAVTHTGVYSRPATGIGQLKALVLITSSLNKAYRKLQINNIQYSEENLSNNMEYDMISLGGPKNNRVTKLILDKINAQDGLVNQVGNDLYWRAGEEITLFKSCAENDAVLKDYGLVIYAPNPFNTKKKAILFSGAHTYGTIAAAKYFTEQAFREKSFFKRSWKTYYAIVSCDIIDGTPINITLEKDYKSY